MLTLGFKPSQPFDESFIAEAAVIDFQGGMIGLGSRLPDQRPWSRVRRTGRVSARRVRLQVTPGLMFQGSVFAVVMGVAGGVLPGALARVADACGCRRALMVTETAD